MQVGEWKLSGFTQDQVHEIEEGLKAGVDVSIYAKKEFYAIQMRQIRLGLAEGLAVEAYARTTYDWFQMEEIRKGLQAGLFVGIYATPSLSYEKMRQVRLGLLDGINLTQYLKLEAGILKELRLALLSGVNIVEYIQQGYGTEQLEQLRIALEKGLDIRPYVRKEFRGVSIRQIRKGLEKGIDVSVYAKMEFSWQQMREIRKGLEARLDITKYSNVFYSWQQMREIRLGLKEGLDADHYRSLMYTAAEMKKRRMRLKNHQLDVILHEHTETEHIDNFRISVSSDEMEAYIELIQPVTGLRREEVMSALKRRGVRAGINETAINTFLQETLPGKSKVIARGCMPRDGADGWYEYFFRTNLNRAPRLLEDGSADYQNIEWFESVKQGQKIVYYHEAEQGIDGYTVTGRSLYAKKGREQELLSGKGFMVMPDGKTYLAVMDGRIELEKNCLEISKLLILDEATMVTGKVDFDGCVYIRGSVGRGAEIKASEDVMIDGFVEGALIQCGGSLILKQGANADGMGMLTVEKNLIGKFLEAVHAKVQGDIHVNYCLNCNLHIEGKLVVSGRNGMLAGGSIHAAKGMQAYHVGNRAGLLTEIRLGIDEAVIKQRSEIEAEQMEVEKELLILKNGYLDFQKKYPAEVRNTMEIYLKIESAIYTKEEQQAALYAAMERLEEMTRITSRAKAVIKGNLYEGVRFEINGQHWQAKRLTNITVKDAGKRVAIFPN